MKNTEHQYTIDALTTHSDYNTFDNWYFTGLRDASASKNAENQYTIDALA